MAEENVIGYITDEDTIKDYEKNIREYYALKVIGDSMILKKKKSWTVKKKVIKTNEGIELHAMNPYYPVKKFTFEDMKNIPIKIIGRVKEAKIKGAFE